MIQNSQDEKPSGVVAATWGHPPMLTQQMREVEPLRPVTANLHRHLMGPILLSEWWGNKNEPLV